MVVPPVYVKIPAKYSDPDQSGLSVEMVAGKDNVVVFALKN
jgi:hypothetical protein